MKLVPKIILEGTRLTHKTDIAFALNEHPRIVHRFLIFTQTYQYIQRGKAYDFTWLEQTLKELDFRLIFCNRSAESFPRPGLKG